MTEGREREGKTGRERDERQGEKGKNREKKSKTER